MHKQRQAEVERQRAIVARRTAAGLPASCFAGVFWTETESNWIMKISVPTAAPPSQRSKYIIKRMGLEEEAAARAYDETAREHFGANAHGGKAGTGGINSSTRWLNFPTAEEQTREAGGGPSYPDAMKAIAACEKTVTQRRADGQDTSPYHGVYWAKRDRRWHARLLGRDIDRNTICELTAAKAWDAEVRRLLGEDAHGKCTVRSDSKQAWGA